MEAAAFVLGGVWATRCQSISVVDTQEQPTASSEGKDHRTFTLSLQRSTKPLRAVTPFFCTRSGMRSFAEFRPLHEVRWSVPLANIFR